MTNAKRKLAEAKAGEYIDLMADSYAAKSAADKIAKELAVMHGHKDFPNFDFEHNGKTYDVGLVVEQSNEVDVVALQKAVKPAEFLKLVECSQKAVKSSVGGEALLNRVLHTITKPAAFKIKARRG